MAHSTHLHGKVCSHTADPHVLWDGALFQLPLDLLDVAGGDPPLIIITVFSFPFFKSILFLFFLLLTFVNLKHNRLHTLPAHRSSSEKLMCCHQEEVINQGLTSSSCRSRSILGKGFLQNIKELNSRSSGSPAGGPCSTASCGDFG